jgi:hypothetical protein
MVTRLDTWKREADRDRRGCLWQYMENVEQAFAAIAECLAEDAAEAPYAPPTVHIREVRTMLATPLSGKWYGFRRQLLARLSSSTDHARSWLT